MAKSWKSFVKKDDDLSQDPESSQELSGIEKELNLSLEELAQSNEQLRAILEERNALEEKMRSLTNPASAENQQGKRFDTGVDSITRKRREDQERFETKKKLEQKLRLKKEEFNSWARKVKRIRDKVTRTKDEFDRKKDELSRVKKKVDEFVRKVKLGPSDDYDYEKLSGPLKKAVGDFPFTEKMGDRTDEIFNRPVAEIREKVIEREPVKKIVDAWGEIKDAKREAAKIKEKFGTVMKKKELFDFDNFDFDDFGSELMDAFGNDDPEKVFKERDKRTPKKKAEQKKKKQSIFDKLKKLREARDAVKKAKKMIDDLPGDSGLPGERKRDEEDSDKHDEEDKKVKRREKRKEQSRAERKADRRQDRMDRKFSKLDSQVESKTENNSEEDIDGKKKEKDELEKRESKREEKIKDRIAQRREERKQEERHERRKRVKDKFD